MRVIICCTLLASVQCQATVSPQEKHHLNVFCWQADSGLLLHVYRVVNNFVYFSGQKQFRPLAAHVRHGHHFKTKNPRLKPIERRVFDEVTQPIYPEPFRHPAETCGKKQQPTAVFEVRNKTYIE